MIKWLSGNTGISESEAENKLLSENWHSYSGFADLDKIKEAVISVKYYVDLQANLEYYVTESEMNYIFQKKDMLESLRVKKNIRIGIPIKYTRELILRLFNVDIKSTKEDYTTRFVSIFKNRDPKHIGDHVPYVSYYDTLEENLTFHFLNTQGLESCKELLWLLYSVVPCIEFSPLLLKIISLCLIFMSKHETYLCIKQLIITDYSMKNLNTLRFRLRFNYEENKRLVPSFIESFTTITANTGREISQKFEKLGFEFEILIEDMFFNLFYRYLNFCFLHRLFLLYLREGCKILYRTAFAILKMFKADILDIKRPENVIRTIKEKCFEMKDIDKFFTLMYSYGLTSKNNKYEEIKIVENFKPARDFNFYIPTINGESSILSDDEIFYLWSIFPVHLKLKDAKLIFSTSYHGYLLEKIYRCCSDPENSCFNACMVIMTKTNYVFGVIMSLPFDRNRTGYYKPSHTSLFIIRPFMQRYDVINPTEKMINCMEDKIIIGMGEEGPAIQIDKDLMIGFSHKSEIFGSPSLAHTEVQSNNSFEIDKIEMFILY